MSLRHFYPRSIFMIYLLDYYSGEWTLEVQRGLSWPVRIVSQWSLWMHRWAMSNDRPVSLLFFAHVSALIAAAAPVHSSLARRLFVSSAITGHCSLRITFAGSLVSSGFFSLFAPFCFSLPPPNKGYNEPNETFSSRTYTVVGIFHLSDSFL